MDLLPDRKAETVASWMRQYPDLMAVSRDRGGDYASAAKASAPQATQHADRFHVMKNLGEALEGMLARHLAAHRRGRTEKVSTTPLGGAPFKLPPKPSPKEALQSQSKREERLACYEQVVALRKLGFSQAAIGKQVGVAHSTVSRWLSSGTFPEQQPRPRKMKLDSHLPYLHERWEAGCHNIAQLHRELVDAGSTLSYRLVHKQLVRYLSGRLYPNFSDDVYCSSSKSERIHEAIKKGSVRTENTEASSWVSNAEIVRSLARGPLVSMPSRL